MWVKALRDGVMGLDYKKEGSVFQIPDDKNDKGKLIYWGSWMEEVDDPTERNLVRKQKDTDDNQKEKEELAAATAEAKALVEQMKAQMAGAAAASPAPAVAEPVEAPETETDELDAETETLVHTQASLTERERDDLKGVAKGLGLEFPPNVPTAKLIEQILEKQGAASANRPSAEK